MTTEAIDHWWADLDEDSRAWFEEAARDERVDTEVVDRLVASRCPTLPIGTKWEGQTGYVFDWPETLRRVVLPEDHV
jgi:hypothetical protein